MAGKGKLAGAAFAMALSLALAIAQPSEGERHHAYLDPVGVPTICDGETHGVKLGQVATHAQCQAMTKAEMTRSLNVLNKYIHVDVPPSVWGALADFEYNEGEGHFARSTLLRLLNLGDTAGACEALMDWDMAGGRVLEGLVIRRGLERALCLRDL